MTLSLAELLPTITLLPQSEKRRLIQWLIAELAQKEGVAIREEAQRYPLWTPYDAFEAAQTLLTALESNHL